MSTQLIKPNYLVILPSTQHHSFFRKLPPLPPKVSYRRHVLLTSYLPPARAALGNIGPKSRQYGPRANIPNSSLLYDTRAMLVLNLSAFKNKKYTAYDRFHGNGSYGSIPTRKQPINTLGFPLGPPCHIINIRTVDQSENEAK